MPAGSGVGLFYSTSSGAGQDERRTDERRDEKYRRYNPVSAIPIAPDPMRTKGETKSIDVTTHGYVSRDTGKSGAESPHSKNAVKPPSKRERGDERAE
jgi:hypothetical protein